ncbi:hypothetical protein HDV05_005736 [Chytridiales sp. JEL 0842]|nr:hypothetical protein HDV05_005736 [Chytridiales sp. JEL 0842]
MSTLAIKVVFGTPSDPITRRFSVPLDPAYPTWKDVEAQELTTHFSPPTMTSLSFTTDTAKRDQIKTIHGIPSSASIVVTYRDEDDEDIAIDTDAELNDLIKSTIQRGAASVRFTVKLVKDGNAESSSPVPKSDPYGSTDSFATFNSQQVSQNISSFLPTPPSPSTLHNEGWKVTVDEGSPPHSSSARVAPAYASSSSAMSRFGVDSGDFERPASQPFVLNESGILSPTSSKVEYPSLPDRSSLSRSPLGVSSSTAPQTSTADPDAQRKMESEIMAVIAEHRAMMKGIPAPESGSGSSTASPEDGKEKSKNVVLEFLDKIREIIKKRNPEMVSKIDKVISKVRSNMHATLELAISEIQQALTRLQHTYNTTIPTAYSHLSTQSQALTNNLTQTSQSILKGASDFQESVTRSTRDFATKAAIEANNASKRAFEEAKEAARRVSHLAGSSSSQKTPAESEPSTTLDPPLGASSDAKSSSYESQAYEAATKGFGLGTPTDPRYKTSTQKGKFEAEVQQLADMGFLDVELNRDLLRMNDGSLERVVEVLARLEME